MFNSLQETVVRIRIISGQNLTKRPDAENVNPYVSLKTRGHPLDKHKYRTKTIDKNGKKTCKFKNNRYIRSF